MNVKNAKASLLVAGSLLVLFSCRTTGGKSALRTESEGSRSTPFASEIFDYACSWNGVVDQDPNSILTAKIRNEFINETGDSNAVAGYKANFYQFNLQFKNNQLDISRNDSSGNTIYATGMTQKAPEVDSNHQITYSADEGSAYKDVPYAGNAAGFANPVSALELRADQGMLAGTATGNILVKYMQPNDDDYYGILKYSCSLTGKHASSGTTDSGAYYFSQVQKLLQPATFTGKLTWVTHAVPFILYGTCQIGLSNPADGNLEIAMTGVDSAQNADAYTLSLSADSDFKSVLNQPAVAGKQHTTINFTQNGTPAVLSATVSGGLLNSVSFQSGSVNATCSSLSAAAGN